MREIHPNPSVVYMKNNAIVLSCWKINLDLVFCLTFITWLTSLTSGGLTFCILSLSIHTQCSKLWQQCSAVCACVSAGGWSVWGQWAQCSSECGGGIQTRTRTCQSPPEESYLCEGVVEEGRPCNSQACTGELSSLCMCVYSFVCTIMSVSEFPLALWWLDLSMHCVQSVCLQLLLTFLFLHLDHLFVYSSISQCFDLRSACWKGDFDRWKMIMTWSTVLKTMHAQYVKVITLANGPRDTILTSEDYYVEAIDQEALVLSWNCLHKALFIYTELEICFCLTNSSNSRLSVL